MLNRNSETRGTAFCVAMCCLHNRADPLRPFPRKSIAKEEGLPRHQKLESRRIAACVLAHVRRHHASIGPLFELLSILDTPTAVDFSFVLDAYKDEFAPAFSAGEKTKVTGSERSLTAVCGCTRLQVDTACEDHDG